VALCHHSNGLLPPGPLRGSSRRPARHTWDHLGTTNTQHNFANLAPWTDLLFGTYHRPPDDEERWPLGNPGEPDKGYLEHLASPFRARREREEVLPSAEPTPR